MVPGPERKRAPLIINMDEASVAFHLSGLVGTVLKTGPFTSLRPGDSVKLSARRGALTYIASICDDPTVNDLLPRYCSEILTNLCYAQYGLCSQSCLQTFFFGGKRALGTMLGSCRNTSTFFAAGWEEFWRNGLFSWLLIWQLATYSQASIRTPWSKESG